MLLIGAAQILFLDVPDHAAVDLSVRLVQADRRAANYPGLINAVLRRVTREGPELLADARCRAARHAALAVRALDSATTATTTARAIAVAHGHEPPLDLTVKADAESWAQRLRGRVLPTGTRAHRHRTGRSRCCPAITEGAWWVQDAAAALPARLLGDVAGKRVADLCAAPGGKTAQLAQAGARVTAVDRSANRLARVRENLDAARPARRHGRRRRDRMAGRAVRRRAGRCALLVDRHDPPPSRRRLAQAARPTSRSSPACSAACSTARSR